MEKNQNDEHKQQMKIIRTQQNAIIKTFKRDNLVGLSDLSGLVVTELVSDGSSSCVGSTRIGEMEIGNLLTKIEEASYMVISNLLQKDVSDQNTM